MACDCEQLDLARNQNGIFVGPTYHIEKTDDQVHSTHRGYMEIAELDAWCRAEIDAGNPWSIFPHVYRQGNIVHIVFTLRPDEVLEVLPSVYDGQGIDQWRGFEVVGANITDMIVAGNEVRLFCDAPPTEVRHALQFQDMTYATATGYSGFRSRMGTSLKKQAILYDGEVRRGIPSFRYAL